MTVVRVPKLQERVLPKDSPVASCNHKQKDQDPVEDFINKAPDARKKAKMAFDEKGRKLKGRKIVITVTLDPDLLDRMDDLSESLGMTRTGFINMIVRKEVDNGMK